MQQLPMAFINIALGGKNAALNSLGKSLSNDDFGQLLGSVQDGREALHQSLVDHLSPEQLAQLEQQLAGGMSLPEAASIYLQQQRQAADLPSTALERLPDGQATPDASSRPRSGLPWPLSQYLSTTAEPPAAPSAAPIATVLEPAGTDSAAAMAAPAPLGTVAIASASEALPALGLPPAESPAVRGAADTPQGGAGPLPVGVVTARLVAGPTAEVVAGESGSGAHTPGPGAYPAFDGAATAAQLGSRPFAGRTSIDTPPPATPSAVIRTGAAATPAVAAAPLFGLDVAVGVGVPTAPGLPDNPTTAPVLPAPPPLVSALRALWRSREPSLPTAIRAPAESTTRPESPLPPPLSLTAGMPSPATPPTLPFGFLAREGQNAPGAAFNAAPQAGPPGANPFIEPTAFPLPNPSPAGAETSSPSDRLVMSLFGAAVGSEGAAGPAARSPTAPALGLAVPQRLTEAGWSQALGERLVLMAGRELQTAEIKLNPAHLGPLEVKLSLHQDRASVSFLSQHAPVREALEQAIPRLREMFNQQELQLVNVDVGQRREPATSGDSAGRGHGSRPGPGVSDADADAGEPIEVAISSRLEDTDGRLDLYA